MSILNKVIVILLFTGIVLDSSYAFARGSIGRKRRQNDESSEQRKERRSSVIDELPPLVNPARDMVFNTVELSTNILSYIPESLVSINSVNRVFRRNAHFAREQISFSYSIKAPKQSRTQTINQLKAALHQQSFPNIKKIRLASLAHHLTPQLLKRVSEVWSKATSIDLTGTVLTRKHGEALSQLNLTELKVSERLTSPEFFEGLGSKPHLKYVTLSSDVEVVPDGSIQLIGSAPEASARLLDGILQYSSIQELTLSGVNLTQAEMNKLENLRNLIAISWSNDYKDELLDYSEYKDKVLIGFSKAPALKELHLENSTPDEFFEVLENEGLFRNLEVLDIRGVSHPIEDLVNFEGLRKLTSLRKLKLSNLVSRKYDYKPAVEEISRLEKLEELTLNIEGRVNFFELYEDEFSDQVESLELHWKNNLKTLKSFALAITERLPNLRITFPAKYVEEQTDSMGDSMKTLLKERLTDNSNELITRSDSNLN